MGLLRWRGQIDPLILTIIVLVLIGLVVLIYRRQVGLRPLRNTLLLTIPKALIAVCLIMACLDPVWSILKPPETNKKILIVTDTSSSMAVQDRYQLSRQSRAGDLEKRLMDRLNNYIQFETLEFDTSLHEPDKQRQNPEQLRNTDLGKCLVDLAERKDIGSYKAVLLVTDGGDERIQNPRLPQAAVYVAGIGTDVEHCNDLSLTGLEHPASVEEQSDFDVTVDLAAWCAADFPDRNQQLSGQDTDFANRAREVMVRLEEQVESRWVDRGQSKAAMDGSGPRRGRISFRVKSPRRDDQKEDTQAASVVRSFRVRIPESEGEFSSLNNERTFTVEQTARTLHVLFYAHEIGWDFNTIRKELAQDPAIALTALFRLSGGRVERYVVQGDRQEGDESLNQGFPARVEVLNQYKCIILGSFPAQGWTEDQMGALTEYVKEGGAVVFLGGDYSFGRGGYGTTALAGLMPWQIRADEPALKAGRFPVSVAVEALDHSLIAEAGSRIQDAGSEAVLESVNQPGPLRTGAMALLETTVGNEPVAVVALQQYGQGRTLGIATNTFWRWTRSGPALAEAYGHFWRQAVRYLTGEEEGGRMISVRWDQPYYSPGEQAEPTIRLAGGQDAGQVHLRAALTYKGEKQALTLQSVVGNTRQFTVKVPFGEKGDYLFRLEALAGQDIVSGGGEAEPLEYYEKTLTVGGRLNEGANLEITPATHAFLENLATQGGGRYFREDHQDLLFDELESLVLADAVTMEIPLVEHRFVYLGIVMTILMVEWFVRRRMNLI